jgi:adenylate cyclase
MTDAEGYTGLAEGMEPGKLVEVVNRYFKALFGAVLGNGGGVVDVKGDGILAVWTSAAPDNVLRAQVCRGCLQIQQAVEEFNKSLPASRLPTRIGVDFGPIAFANVGAFSRYEYRAIGDTVNTCSRLQELNKRLGTRILVSQQFAESVEGFLFRDLGYFMLRGKRSRMRVLELVAERAQAAPQEVQLCRAFNLALAAFEGGRIDEARLRFERLRERYPEDAPAHFFWARCTEWNARLDLAAVAATPAPIAAFAAG